MFGRPFQIEKKKPLPASFSKEPPTEALLTHWEHFPVPVESGVYFNPVTVGRVTTILVLSPVSSPRRVWPTNAGGRARSPKAWLPAIRAGGRPSPARNKASSPSRSCRTLPVGGLRILFPLASRPAGGKNRRIWLSERRSPLRPGQWFPQFSFSASLAGLAVLRPVLASGCSQGRPRRRQLNGSAGRRPAFYAVKSDVSAEPLPKSAPSSSGRREAAWA